MEWGGNGRGKKRVDGPAARAKAPRHTPQRTGAEAIESGAVVKEIPGSGRRPEGGAGWYNRPMNRRRIVGPFVAALLAAAPAAAQTIASQHSTTPYPGLRLVEGRTAGPATNFHAAFISLCTDYVHVTATRPPTALQRASAWATATGVQLATNGDFFVAGPRVYGYAIGGGRGWPVANTGVDPAVAGQWYYRHYGWIGFGAHTVEFSHTEHVKQHAAALGVTEGWMPTTVTTAVPRGLTALVSGFPELVTEGHRVTCADPTASTCFPDRTDMRARNPRTAMGLSRDRRTFILVAMDGRTGTSAGFYGTEEARLLELLGAWQAFNIDGGGSTTMWLRGRGVINAPSDGVERPVANHWGIFAGSASGQPRTPGSCPVVTTPDAGVPDAGLRDAGALDAGPRDAATDIGVRDATPDVLRDVLADLGYGDLGPDVLAPRDVVTATDAPVVTDVAPTDDVPTILDDAGAPADDADVTQDDAGVDDDTGPAEELPDFVPDAGGGAMPDDLTLAQPGCGCRTGSPVKPGFAWGLLALAAVRRRRRSLGS